MPLPSWLVTHRPTQISQQSLPTQNFLFFPQPLSQRHSPNAPKKSLFIMTQPILHLFLESKIFRFSSFAVNIFQSHRLFSLCIGDNKSVEDRRVAQYKCKDWEGKGHSDLNWFWSRSCIWRGEFGRFPGCYHYHILQTGSKLGQPKSPLQRNLTRASGKRQEQLLRISDKEQHPQVRWSSTQHNFILHHSVTCTQCSQSPHCLTDTWRIRRTNRQTV